MGRCLAVVTGLLVMTACAVKSADSELRSSPAYDNAMLSYRLSFKEVSATSAQLNIEYQGSIIKVSSCAVQLNGAPAIEGPISGTIKCSEKNGSVEALFNLLDTNTQKYWVGIAGFDHNGWRGGEYSCYPGENAGNALDCFWKPGSEPPPAGSVSN